MGAARPRALDHGARAIADARELGVGRLRRVAQQREGPGAAGLAQRGRDGAAHLRAGIALPGEQERVLDIRPGDVAQRDGGVAAALGVVVAQGGEHQAGGLLAGCETTDGLHDVGAQRRLGALQPGLQRRQGGGTKAAQGAGCVLGQIRVGQEVDERVDVAKARGEAGVSDALEQGRRWRSGHEPTLGRPRRSCRA
jgi:hypothetical protein